MYGNSSKNIKDTTAIYSDVGKQITNAIFGTGPKDQLGKGVIKSYGVAQEFRSLLRAKKDNEVGL